MGFMSIKNIFKKSASKSDSDGGEAQETISKNRESKAGDSSGAANGKARAVDAGDSGTGTGGSEEFAGIPKVPKRELKHKYTLVEQVGEGAFSKVFKALDLKNNNKPVAIKIIDKHDINQAQLDSVLKEIDIMERLDHKNVVAMREHIQTSSFFYLVLEYCAGGEIFKQIINFTYFSENLSRHIIIQVAQAVKYLHAEGVAHRDIKPENLLFVPCEYTPRTALEISAARRSSDSDDMVDEGKFRPGVGGGGIGVVKIADFGLSKWLWNTTTQTPCGTAGYTAPEIVKAEKYSKSVDLWAVGCVLYTLLCGFPPFFDDDNDTLKLLEKCQKGDFEFLSPWWDEISVEAKRLVTNLLNVNPLQRYDIDQLLTDPWITGGKTPLTEVKHNYLQDEYFPTCQYVETTHLSPHESRENSTSVTPLGTPVRANPNNGETLIAKEMKLRSVFSKNIEIQRDNEEELLTKSWRIDEAVPLQRLAELDEDSSSPELKLNIKSPTQPALILNKKDTGITNKSNVSISLAGEKESYENGVASLTETLRSVKFKKRNLPKTPCPTKVNFDDEDEEDEVDSDSDGSDEKLAESASSDEFVHDQLTGGRLDNFSLDMNNSSMLERRRQSNAAATIDKRKTVV